MPTRLPDSLLSGLSDALAAQMGLHFPKKSWVDLERGIVAATKQLGQPDTEACARWLLSAPMTQKQIEVLASHLTIGETYFFREKRSFAALEAHIFPELFSTRTGLGRSLRIWSVGCCTGEEPYSIAMLLDRLVQDPAEWNIDIVATDINPEFLRKAKEGVYGEWSFRDTPDWIRGRYFNRRQDGRFELQPRFRKKVRFSYLNLAEAGYPSALNNTHAMDVIFCRNVLMYFSEARVKQVVANLHRALADGGWLIVSPSETSNDLFSGFTPVWFPGAMLYRKGAKTPASESASPVTVPPPHPEPQPWIGASRVEQATPPAALREAPLPFPLSPDETLPSDQIGSEAQSRAARDCANHGRHDEALAWCEKAIAGDKFNPSLHYLHATIRQELGQNDAAAQALRRALYLDPDFLLAHFALGSLRLMQGACAEADRHFSTALMLLRGHAQDAIFPGSEGLTAGQLTEMINSARLSLPQAAIGAPG